MPFEEIPPIWLFCHTSRSCHGWRSCHTLGLAALRAWHDRMLCLGMVGAQLTYSQIAIAGAVAAAIAAAGAGHARRGPATRPQQPAGPAARGAAPPRAATGHPPGP